MGKRGKEGQRQNGREGLREGTGKREERGKAGRRKAERQSDREGHLQSCWNGTVGTVLQGRRCWNGAVRTAL